MLIVFAVTAAVWFALERRRFQGPPLGVITQQRALEIEQAEKAEKAEKAVGQIARHDR